MLVCEVFLPEVALLCFVWLPTWVWRTENSRVFQLLGSPDTFVWLIWGRFRWIIHKFLAWNYRVYILYLAFGIGIWGIWYNYWLSLASISLGFCFVLYNFSSSNKNQTVYLDWITCWLQKSSATGFSKVKARDIPPLCLHFFSITFCARKWKGN